MHVLSAKLSWQLQYEVNGVALSDFSDSLGWKLKE
jgi:hypothetical protein